MNKSKIYVVGFGPGGEEFMTAEAKNAIADSDVVVGYHVYVDLVRHLSEGKEILSTSMTKEVARCELALEKAKEGKTVAFVCSGDAGVYGMAGIMLEIAEGTDIEIKTVAGITAACSGAAVLGAPLIHDFAIISLSDLLTPWEKIEKRIELTAEADFVVVLYNPKSKTRVDYIDQACELMMKHKSPDTICGYVKNIGREGETATICKLTDLMENDNIDMFTTVFIGNSQTRVIDGKIVTPRGYQGKQY